MIDEAKLAELEMALRDMDLPWCRTWMRAGIRHLQRNCEIECDEHGADRRGECNGPGRYDGDKMADILNASAELIALARIGLAAKEQR